MRTVLCFGDSNTYAQVPGAGPLNRYPMDSRCPGMLKCALGEGWHVTEEGLSGRTTVYDDPIQGALKNRRAYLRACLESHAPLDLIIIMLGASDPKVRYNELASELAMGICFLVDNIRELSPSPDGHDPEIMIAAPPPMLDDVKETKRRIAFWARCSPKRRSVGVGKDPRPVRQPAT